MKASIKGEIQCPNDDDAHLCSSILDKYYISHDSTENKITVDALINVTAVFDNDGFERMLRSRLSRHGKCRLNVSLSR